MSLAVSDNSVIKGLLDDHSLGAVREFVAQAQKVSRKVTVTSLYYYVQELCDEKCRVTRASCLTPDSAYEETALGKETLIQRDEEEKELISIEWRNHPCDVKERIYVRANPEDHLTLAKLITSSLFDTCSEVFGVKVAGPKYTHRSDNIVIYLSDADASRVVQKLKEIYQQCPDYFSKRPILFRQMIAPGIGTINGLGRFCSYGEVLCTAIYKTLRKKVDILDLDVWREAVASEFTSLYKAYSTETAE